MAGFVELRSLDWSVTNSAVVGDQSCRGRLFNGAASITLRPDELKLDCNNVAPDAYPVVFETLRRALSLMDADFSQHPYDFCSVTCNQHADVSGPESADAYLAQYSYPHTLTVLEGLEHVTYEPSLRILLPWDNGEIRLQRTIEKSAVTPGALFVSTSILFSKGMIASSGAPEIMQSFQDACRYADQAIGLEWEGSS